MTGPIVLTPHQCAAVNAALDALADGTQVFAIRGLAGTGKTTLIPHLRQLIRDTLKTTTSVGSPTHRAARILKKKGVVDATTIHSLALTPYFKGDYAWACRWLGEDCPARASAIEDRTPDIDGVPYLLHGACARKRIKPKTLLGHVRRHGAKKAMASVGINGKNYFDEFGPKQMDGVLIVDEASMVGAKMLALCLEAFPQVLLIGDPGQLQPVKDTAQLAQAAGVDLSEIHRQAADSAIIQLAYAARAGDVSWRQFTPSATGDVRQAPEADAVRFVHSPLLVWRNGVREQCTHAIRTQLGYTRDAAHVGEPLMCRATSPRDRAEGFFNQGLWRVVETSKHDARCVTIQEEDTDVTADVLLHLEELDGDAVDPDSVPFRFAYAMTVHTAQGGEWDEVFVSKKELMAFESSAKKRRDDEYKCYAYTAITRAKSTLTLLTEHHFLSCTSGGVIVPVLMELPADQSANAAPVLSVAPEDPREADIPDPDVPHAVLAAASAPQPPSSAVTQIPENLMPLAHGFCDYIQHRLNTQLQDAGIRMARDVETTITDMANFAKGVLSANEHAHYSFADALAKIADKRELPYTVTLKALSSEGFPLELTIRKETAGEIVEVVSNLLPWLVANGYTAPTLVAA